MDNNIISSLDTFDWPAVFTRDSYASRVLAMAWASVRLSVCPSVTPLSPIKTVQAKITKSLLWAAPRTLVFRDKVSCPWVRGFPSNESVKEGYLLKRRYLAIIGLPSVNTVADRYTQVAYHNKHWTRAY